MVDDADVKKTQVESKPAVSTATEERYPRYEIEQEFDGRWLAEDTAFGLLAYGATPVEALSAVIALEMGGGAGERVT